MEWIQVSIATTHDGVETLTSSLEDIGIRGFEIEDPADFTEFMQAEFPYRDYVDEELIREKSDAPIKVKIYVDKKRVTLSSEWFDIEMELHEDKWCRPDDFLIVCSIAMFLKKELQFVPHDKDNEKEYTIAAELDRLMNAFNKNNFYSTGKVMNDGFYTYSQDLGRISMTRKEFMEKFPHATAMLEK